MLRAGIFDLDGTLADTLESMAHVTNIILKKFHLKNPFDRGFQILFRRRGAYAHSKMS